VLWAVGWGPWHCYQVLRGRHWAQSSQPPGKFMSILSRDGQEVSRQATSFRHAFLKEMKKGNVNIVKWAFPTRKCSSQREKKSPKQVCPQTTLALALFLPFSALLSSVTGSSTVGISFLSDFFCSTFSTVTIKNCMYHNCSFQLKERISSARSFIVSSVVSLPKI